MVNVWSVDGGEEIDMTRLIQITQTEHILCFAGLYVEEMFMILGIGDAVSEPVVEEEREDE